MSTSTSLQTKHRADRYDQLLRLLADITGKQVTTPKGSLRGYFQSVPVLLGKTFLGPLVSPTTFSKQMKACALSEHIYLPLIEAMGNWENWDEALADALLRSVVPALMGISSMHRRDNDTQPVSIALGRLAEQVGQGKVRLVSLVCPSYRYRRDASGKLWHCSGELLPTIGPRFRSVASTLGRVFAPLSGLDVEIVWQFWCYTGETGDPEHLVDMARFVHQYYQGEMQQLFTTLGMATDDMGRQLKECMGACGIKAFPGSLDGKFGARIYEIRKSFSETFPKQLEQIYHSEEVEAWLESICGCGPLIHYFVEQERIYRQNVLIAFTEPLVVAALREMLLYIHILDEVRNDGLIVIDTESTSNYMTETLRYRPAGLIFTRSDKSRGNDEKSGEYTLDIRQPYNIVNG